MKQVNDMLQVLLEERFALKLHREIRDQKGYRLITARSGAKLKSWNPTPPPQNSVGESDNVNGGLPVPPMPKMSGVPGMRRYGRTGITSDGIADLLSLILHTPVMDKTGLTGKYEISLEISPPAEDLEGQVFAAVKRLGLELEAGKVPVEVLVIDHVSKTPTPD